MLLKAFNKKNKNEIDTNFWICFAGIV